MHLTSLFVVFGCLIGLACCRHELKYGFADWSDDISVEKWQEAGQKALKEALNIRPNTNLAKNIILFVGDGMGLSTVTAGRIRKGQLDKKNGEELVTHMENLPHVALSKTYNIDLQTPDSAGTATAFLTGVKTRAGIVGYDGHAVFCDCNSTKGASRLDSILKIAHRAGKAVGIVTTTRVTHATPASAYAYSANRDWETYDENFEKHHKLGCKDIAAQLIEENDFIDLVLGGGRKNFYPRHMDEGQFPKRGVRADNRHLINEWIAKMRRANKTHKYISNAEEFRKVNFRDYDHVLGLLSHDHMRYEGIRANEFEPSLVEMTEKAIQMLSRNKNGYFLLVEGGRIDHGHHESKAARALDEFVVLDNAVGKALDMTSEKETLVVVTADHSHTFTLGGFAIRGNPILGVVVALRNSLSDLNTTYTSLGYANGPGGLLKIRRFNITNKVTEDGDFVQESAVFRKSETHGGEDVAIYASGPMSHLFTKTVEQSYIFHVMAYSSCIGKYANEECLQERGGYSNADVSEAKKMAESLLAKTSAASPGSFVKIPLTFVLVCLVFLASRSSFLEILI